LPYVYDRYTASGEVLLESVKLLKELFEAVLDGVEKVTFLVIDGIDECPETEAKKMLSWLPSIIRQIHKKRSKVVRCLFASRDEGYIRDTLSKEDTRKIIPQDIEEDIRTYTHARSLQIAGDLSLSSEMTRRISEVVTERAKGQMLFELKL
jgi:hypothetical protein